VRANQGEYALHGGQNAGEGKGVVSEFGAQHGKVRLSCVWSMEPAARAGNGERSKGRA
jgi:hypothetical protein